VSTPVLEKPDAPARVSITVAAISTPTIRVKVRWGASLSAGEAGVGWGGVWVFRRGVGRGGGLWVH
jgi:hypothetical protein